MQGTETYESLAACARRRLESEWTCSDAERRLLLLVTQLSYDLGQSYALVPSLADFAAALGVHKSTVCRALKAARGKGYLVVVLRREETLYSICLETRGSEREQQEGAEVRARLIALNRRRDAGKADADGQVRLPGVFSNEETGAPARAFSAMMEGDDERPSTPVAPNVNIVPRGTSKAEDERRRETLEMLNRVRCPESIESNDAYVAKRAEIELKARLDASEPSGNAASASRPDDKSMDAAMKKLCKGLNDQQTFALERLREEFASAGKIQHAHFFSPQFSRVWRQRAMKQTEACLQAAAAHKAKRLEDGKPAKEPGAWIYSAMRSLEGV